MNPFFLWLEATPLSVWVRESTSVMAFPAILSVHALGMGIKAGIGAALALRILGVAPAIPIREFQRFVALMWFGFWINAASGILLLIAYPTKALTNPVFYVKIALIVLALWTFRQTRRLVFDSDERQASVAKLKTLAVVTLASWAGAITAGRLLAYTYRRLFADW